MEDAMRTSRWATISIQPIAVCVAMSAMLAASVAHGTCCVCQGAKLDKCFGFSIPGGFSCTNCSDACGELGGAVRSCSDAVADCAGVADSCTSNVCAQTQTGAGFCDSPTPT